MKNFLRCKNTPNTPMNQHPFMKTFVFICLKTVLLGSIRIIIVSFEVVAAPCHGLYVLQYKS